MEEAPGLKRIDKIFYGMGRFGSTTLLTIFSIATFYLYDKVYGVDPVLNGIANALGKIAIAISGFVMGYISDITIHPKLGRRKPFIISGTTLLALSFILLYIPEFVISLQDKFLLFIWEAIWASSFNFFYGYLLTPYQAWLPEITRPDERVEVSGYENLFNILGNIVGMGGAFAIPLILALNRAIWYQLIVVLGITEILFYLPAYFRIREPEVYIKQPNILKELKIVVSNVNYMTWIFSRGILSVGVTMLTALIMIFLEDYLHFIGLQYLIVAISVMIIIMFFFLIWGIISKKYRIKKSMIIALASLGSALVSLYMLRFIPAIATRQVLGITLMLIGAIGLSGYWLFNYVILANIIEGDTILTGESRAGIYTGFDSIVLNLWQALGYMLTGYVRKMFVGEAHVAWGPIAGIFVLIGLLVFFYVDPEPHLTLKKEK